MIATIKYYIIRIPKFISSNKILQTHVFIISIPQIRDRIHNTSFSSYFRKGHNKLERLSLTSLSSLVLSNSLA